MHHVLYTIYITIYTNMYPILRHCLLVCTL